MLAYTSSASILESDLAQSTVKGIKTAAAEGIQLRGAASAIDFTKLDADDTDKVSIDRAEVYGPSTTRSMCESWRCHSCQSILSCDWGLWWVLQMCVLFLLYESNK